ncbi:hypothetical protein [Kineococcus glutinatus]|uniref:HEAT repeat domain-containing protein n=1 Tax=Kineococcus glutinatus TaxID=1070872 RepID=A0ABP9HPB9_9ACTN
MVDWARLAGPLLQRKDMAGVQSDGTAVLAGGTSVARMALEHLLGAEAWRQAVRRYVHRSWAPDTEMVRSVLRLVQPEAGMQECLRLWREGTGEERIAAVELAQIFTRPEVLDAVPQMLADPEPLVPVWAAVIVREFVYDGVVEGEDVHGHMQLMEAHHHPSVREVAAGLRAWLSGDPAPGEVGDD